MTLTEFLLARIGEDEAATRAALSYYPEPWVVVEGAVTENGRREYAVVDWQHDEVAEHIAHWDPARVLAECGAKRRIVEEHPLGEGEDGHWESNIVVGCLRCISCAVTGEDIVDEGPCATLRALALPYAEHPDYDEAWRP